MKIGRFDQARSFTDEGLKAIDEAFDASLGTSAPDLADRFRAYRTGADIGQREESNLLIAVARVLEDWLIDEMDLGGAREALRLREQDEDVVQAFKAQCVHGPDQRGRVVEQSFATLDALLWAHLGEVGDREQAVASLWAEARDREDGRVMSLLSDWVWVARSTVAGREATHHWVSLRDPERLVPHALVRTEAAGPDSVCLEGANGRRERDGFDLTDDRGSAREVRDQVHYCVYCHDRGSDFCSRGFTDKGATVPRTNALGVVLSGCPLGERISEAHALKRDRYTLGALAVVMIDNPLLALTGHRICNDCTRSCIYQKQTPVDIPRIETRILTDVLDWPWGVELYSLLLRWNPLCRRRPCTRRYHGRKVLCVGMGPAGISVSYHLLQEGFGVVAVDGLRLEPLWAEGVAHHDPRAPIRDWSTLTTDLDSRVSRGFGGVAEYGITVRWDKNFLRLVEILLARYTHFGCHGGVRFGGTLQIEDAWRLGFDHVALATGAGRPAPLPVPNGLAQGVRSASDFLMALQLTGAARRDTLANLEVRLPGVVIGGGLTAIDAATELQAYYVRQVEKILERHTVLRHSHCLPRWSDSERRTLAEFLKHGRRVRSERRRAGAEGRAPRIGALVRSFGGVTVVYRHAMSQSPAYRRNNEEITKALEEGIFYVEQASPRALAVDDEGHVKAVHFDRIVAPGADAVPLTLPAGTVLVATGASPNTVYEREHPGTFELSGVTYTPHRWDRVSGGLVAAAGAGDPGHFTSYRKGEHLVSFHGDMHPRYHGSVVTALASGADGARAITERVAPAAVDVPAHDWTAFAAHLHDLLTPIVVSNERLGPTLNRLTVRAPAAAQQWQPGQLFRLQTLESRTTLAGPVPLHMEGVALDGVGADRERGTVTALLRTTGASTRIGARLRPGDPVVLMGPTGTAAPVPHGKRITVIGGHAALTTLIEAHGPWTRAGNRVLFVAHVPSAHEADEIRALAESAAERVIWVLDRGPSVVPRRATDSVLTGGIEALISATIDGSVRDWAFGEHLIVSDDPLSMARLREAIIGPLAAWMVPDQVRTAAVTSPMQCMMKEVCAQCLCLHRPTAEGGTPSLVFSCFNHHQPLMALDLVNLRLRQRQNGTQERLTDAWLCYWLADKDGLTSATRGAADRTRKAQRSHEANHDGAHAPLGTDRHNG